MLFRVLLNILRPSNEQLRGKATGKIKMYHFLLKRLLKTYLHYAMSDIITIDNGNVKIVHEFRDLEFEDELIRNKIKFKSDLLTMSFPIIRRKSKAVLHARYFKFKNVLSVYVGEKELFVKHDEYCSVDGTVNGKLKGSSNDNYLSQSIIEILSSLDRTQTRKTKDNPTKEQPSVTSQKSKKYTQGIFEKDKDILSVVSKTDFQSDGYEVIGDNKKIIEKKGFDIDTIF